MAVVLVSLSGGSAFGRLAQIDDGPKFDVIPASNQLLLGQTVDLSGRGCPASGELEPFGTTPLQIYVDRESAPIPPLMVTPGPSVHPGRVGIPEGPAPYVELLEVTPDSEGRWAASATVDAEWVDEGTVVIRALCLTLAQLDSEGTSIDPASRELVIFELGTFSVGAQSETTTTTTSTTVATAPPYVPPVMPPPIPVKSTPRFTG